MKHILAAIFGLGFLTSAASAEPVQLTTAQMDEITAGTAPPMEVVTTKTNPAGVGARYAIVSVELPSSA